MSSAEVSRKSQKSRVFVPTRVICVFLTEAPADKNFSKEGEVRMWNRYSSVFLVLLVTVPGAACSDEFDAATVFNSRCGACHTVGRGDDVGPDLQGVTERRDRDWLISFIRSSQSVIGAGDPTAVELFERYGRQKMPDHPYTADQIGQILAYVEAGGPSSMPRIRSAASATPEDVRAGRAHFFGERGPRASCASCHGVGGDDRLAILYLGGSLAGTFTEYGDLELARALAKSRGLCRRALQSDESFAVRAYLRHLASSGGDGEAPARLFPILSFGIAALFLALPRLLGTLRDRREDAP